MNDIFNTSNTYVPNYNEGRFLYLDKNRSVYDTVLV